MKKNEIGQYNSETGTIVSPDERLLLAWFWNLVREQEVQTPEYGVVAVATLHNLQKINGARLFAAASKIMQVGGRIAETIPVPVPGDEPADSDAMAVAIDKILRLVAELLERQKHSSLAKKLNGRNLVVASDVVLWVTRNGDPFSYDESEHMLNLSRQPVNAESLKKQRERLKELYCSGPFTMTYDIAYAAAEVEHDSSKKARSRPYSVSDEIRATGVRVHIRFNAINEDLIDKYFNKEQIDPRLPYINAGVPFFDKDTPEFRQFMTEVTVEPLKPYVHQTSTHDGEFKAGYLNRGIKPRTAASFSLTVEELDQIEREQLYEVLNNWIIKAVPPTAPALLQNFGYNSGRQRVVIV